MGVLICSECGVEEEFFGAVRRMTCFKHHIKSLNLGFTYGKADWHGDTVKQRYDQQVHDAKQAGREITPVGTRWV